MLKNVQALCGLLQTLQAAEEVLLTAPQPTDVNHQDKCSHHLQFGNGWKILPVLFPSKKGGRGKRVGG